MINLFGVNSVAPFFCPTVSSSTPRRTTEQNFDPHQIWTVLKTAPKRTARMSKRTADEAELKSASLLKRKRLNKEKKNQAKAAEKAKSRKSQESNDEPPPPPLEEADTPRKVQKRIRKEAAREEKTERKAAKKAKLLAEKAANGESPEEPTLEEIAAKEATKADKLQRKLDKAEKAQKKAVKAAEKSTSASTVPILSTSSDASPEQMERRKRLEALIAEPESLSATPKYTPHSELQSTPESEINDYLALHAITIADPGQDKPTVRPITAFKYLPINEDQLAIFKTFTSPTPIQAAAWPHLLSGKDLIGIAETGSGKTLAFGIPCIEYIKKSRDKRNDVVKAVIVSPTRELALQIYEQMKKLGEPVNIKVVCLYGGVAKDAQKKELKNANIVVATPGRLNDLISEQSINIGNAGYVVLDEADRMLDKGFEDDVRKIISATRPLRRRQTLMFTATWPESVRKLASTFMKDPVKINIGHATGELRANTRIEQVVEVVHPHDKQRRLLDIVKSYRRDSKNEKNSRVLIFALYKKEADRLNSFLQSNGISCVAIHGDMTQQQRIKSLDLFKTAEVPCLIATDVASRGLDIPEVKLVINATFPLTAEDYVHRIGRTGRAGASGKALTLFTEHDKPLAGS